MGSEHVECGGGEDEVAETAVELLLQVQMVERLHEMSPVEVRVDTKHLAENGLADLNKILREGRALPHPVRLSGAGQLRKGSGGNAGVVCIRNTGRVSGEDLRVVNLARYPSLHKRDIFVGRKLYWLSSAVQPSKGVVPVTDHQHLSQQFERGSSHTGLRTCVGMLTDCKWTSHPPPSRE